MENKLNRVDLIFKAGNKKKDKTCDFQSFKTIKSFRRKVYNNDLSLDDGLEQQVKLKNDSDIFRKSTKPKESVKNERRALTLKNGITLLNARQKVLNAFESGLFSKGKQRKRLTSVSDCVARLASASDCKVFDHKQLKILTPKQMPPKLPISSKTR